MTAHSAWEPPTLVSFDEVLKLNDEVTAKAGAPIEITEDIFRIHELAMDWDIGVVRYDPKRQSHASPTEPDGKKVGMFLLHGGVSDFKSVERIAKLLPEKFGIPVATMTFPGRFYFHDANRDWPGDVENRRRLGAHAALDQGNQDHPGSVHHRQGHFEA